LRDNIVFGLPYADDAAVLVAAEIAGLDEFVNRHPRGFDIPVGERGEQLSGGQRQSVGIARAVLHNAPILMLDEATNEATRKAMARIARLPVVKAPPVVLRVENLD
jgi:ATP-binding cassette subfamily C protein LapB